MINKMVFDIECIGVDWDSLDETSQHNLLRNCNGDTACEKEEKEKLALWPVTGEIVAIGMLNPDTQNAKVYFVGKEGDTEEYEKDGVAYKMGSEKDVLVWFFDDLKYFDQVITFNGRGFDAPYILFRAMVHGVTPTFDLMPNRYGDYRSGYNAHLDLADQLSYYGSTRKFSLHLLTRALGITSPKEDGVDGQAVPRLFADGEYKTIAEYCMRDVYATEKLWRKWQAIQVK